MTQTLHFLIRRSQRCLRNDVFDFLYEYGTEVCYHGYYYILRIKKNLPSNVSMEMVKKAENWTLIRGENGNLITCTHSNNPAKQYLRKGKIRDAA